MRAVIFSLVLLALVSALLFVPARFALTFELFGNPVISSNGKWLGPTPRDSKACTSDVGKVNVWTCADTSIFSRHEYGCKTWLRQFGYLEA